MLTPVPRAILAFVQARIITLSGLPEAKVHFFDPIDAAPEDLPEVVLYSLQDRPKTEDGADEDGSETRVFEFGATVSVASQDEADTDALAVQVRQAVLADPFLGGLTLATSWSGQEWGQGNASKPTAMTKLTFTATYPWSPEW